MEREHKINLWYVIFSIFAVILIQSYFTKRHIQTIPYSEFQRDLNGGKIGELVITQTQITA